MPLDECGCRALISLPPPLDELAIGDGGAFTVHGIPGPSVEVRALDLEGRGLAHVLRPRAVRSALALHGLDQHPEVAVA